MVDHLTRVIVGRDAPRSADLVRALASLGFAIREEPRRIVADSSTVEAGEAKVRLRSLGFGDRDYQLLLEFVRQWGVM
jgi:hypothetical protein